MKTLVWCVAPLALFGCGSSSGGPVSAAWLGAFNADVTQIEDCSGVQHTDTLSGTITLVAGSNGGTVVTQPGSNDCDLTWTVNGDSAGLASTQTCPTGPGSVGGTWTPTFTAGTLGLSGTTITLGDNGTAVFVDNGTTQTCQFTQSGTFSK
jgi:hypothetical protein